MMIGDGWLMVQASVWGWYGRWEVDGMGGSWG